jgi:small subunit ribosomal protein S6e
MTDIRFVVNDTQGKKSYPKTLQNNPYLGSKIGDKISGNELGLVDYELEITGGSDIAGFPMRRDVDGFVRKKIYTIKTQGVKDIHGKKGAKIRKTVAPNQINKDTVQINLKIIKYGTRSIKECLGIEDKPAEQKEA